MSNTVQSHAESIGVKLACTFSHERMRDAIAEALSVAHVQLCQQD